jgi:hypothetical protein
MIGAKDIKSVDDLRAKGKDCRIATQPPGGGQYGTARSIVRAYNLQCELVSFPTDDAILNGLTSGATDAATGVSPAIYTVRDKGQANLVVDPAKISEADGVKLVPKPVPYWVVAGVSDQIEKKREAVQRFIAALREAAALAEPMSVNQFTTSMASWKDAFDGIPVKGLEQTMTLLKPGMPTGERAGEITPAAWTEVLDAFAFWQLPGVKKTDPEVQYDQIVDNSYFDATKPLPLCEGGKQPTVDAPCRVS